MIKFLANNFVDSALITATSENAQYPISNINDDRRTKTYRSLSDSDSLIFDLGMIEAVDSFAIVSNWQNGFGVTSLTLEANGSTDFTSPAFTTTIELDSTYGIGIKEFTEQSYRYWRLVCTSTLGYCELANMFIGKSDKILTNGVGYNWAFTNKDLKNVSTNRYGQEFIDYKTTRKELTNVTYSIMDSTEMDILQNAYDNVTTVKPCFIYFPLEVDGIVSNDNRYNGMYRFISPLLVENVNSGYFNTSLALRECK